MKKLHFITLMIALVALSFFTACKSNDPERANAFTIDGQNFSLQNGYISADRGLRIMLQSGTYSETTGFSANTQNSFQFSMEGESINDLVSGTYTYTSGVVIISPNPTPDDSAPTFYSLDIYSNIVVNPENRFFWSSFTRPADELNLNSGTMTVSKSGNIYTFDITLSNQSGQAVRVYYKGTLTEIAF